MANGLRIIPNAIQSIDSATLSGTYQAMGVAMPYACCLIKFVNNTDEDVTISWNGITDHDIVIAGGFALYDINSDAGAQRGLYVPQGTIFYVKGTAGSGLFYLVSFYTSEF